MKIRTAAPEETQQVAQAIAPFLQAGDVLLLIGDMGAGKTTFVKGLAAALGVSEPITSPTFVLLHTYNGRIPIHHADLYRLDQLGEVFDLGLTELIEDGVALIEWGDRGEAALPTDAMRLAFDYDDDDESIRTIAFSAHGDRWRDRLPNFVDVLSPWVVEQ